mgnify:CR=1 FL=1
MTTRNLLDVIKKLLNCKQSDIAEKAGWESWKLVQRMSKETLRVPELFELLDANDIKMQVRIREIGKTYTIKRDENGVATSRSVLESALKPMHKTKAFAARSIDWYPMLLEQRLLRDTLKCEDLLRMWEAIGVDVILINAKTGEVAELERERKQEIGRASCRERV